MAQPCGEEPVHFFPHVSMISFRAAALAGPWRTRKDASAATLTKLAFLCALQAANPASGIKVASNPQAQPVKSQHMCAALQGSCMSFD